MANLDGLRLTTRVQNALELGHEEYLKYPEFTCSLKYKDQPEIRTIEYLIALGLNGVKNKYGIGKEALNEIAYKVNNYAEKYKTKYEKTKFEYIEHNKKTEKIPKGYFKTALPKKGYVYAMQLQGDVHLSEDLLSFTKIGHSKNFPTKRHASIKGSCPFSIKLCGYLESENAPETEKKLHLLFKKYRKNGEWFELNYLKIKELVIENFPDLIWSDY